MFEGKNSWEMCPFVPENGCCFGFEISLPQGGAPPFNWMGSVTPPPQTSRALFCSPTSSGGGDVTLTAGGWSHYTPTRRDTRQPPSPLPQIAGSVHRQVNGRISSLGRSPHQLWGKDSCKKKCDWTLGGGTKRDQYEEKQNKI